MRKTLPRRIFFRPVLAAWLLVWGLLLAGPALVRAEVTDPGVYAELGETRVKLLNPAHLIRVDGSTPETDALFREHLLQQGARLLAVYVEPVAWGKFKSRALSGQSFLLPDFFATLTTPAGLADQTVAPDFFAALKDENLLPAIVEAGGEILDNQPRCFTFKVDLNREGEAAVTSRQIVTMILVEGRVLALTTISGPDNQFADQFLDSALSWRQAYLEKTGPEPSAVEK